MLWADFKGRAAGSGAGSRGALRCQWEAGDTRLQVTSLSCSLADDKVQDMGTGSHSPVEWQNFLVRFFWQKHFQVWGKILVKDTTSARPSDH